jgi:hypothetical protein
MLSTRRFLIGLMAFTLGCGSSGSGGKGGTSGGTAGATGTGGSGPGTGGNTTGSGGTTGAGGTNVSGTGGTTTGTGGSTTGTGGSATGTGGSATGTGGSATGTGGSATGTGGSATGTGGSATGTGGRGGTTGTGGRGGTTGTGGSSGATGTGGSSATQTSTNVTTFHNNLGRTGVYVDANLTIAKAAGIHIDTSFANTAIMGPVYAQPLYLGGAGSSQPDMVVVTTAQNRVYALNASTGAEVWANMQYGAPITTQADINSQNHPLLPFGVVGTGTIDPATRTLYFSAGTLVSSKAVHRIHAVDLTNGMEKSGWPVAVETAAKNAEDGAFVPTNQNQRAALALVGSRVYVPYGGHIGDADNYHGWVVGVSTTTPSDVLGWSTRAACGGIWATSGIASEGTNVIFTTGNTKASASGGFSAPSTYGDGEAVYRLGANLARTTTAADFFYPSNWSSLDSGDTDISGSGVMLFDLQGATPSALALVLGKDGNAYLLNRTNMGGMSATPLALKKVANGNIIQAGAVYTTTMGTYFVFRGGVSGCPTGMSGGLMAVKISAANPPVLTPAWCAGPTQASNPIVSVSSSSGADPIVWVVGTNGQLSAFNGDTGASVLSGSAISLASIKGHQTPIVANGRVFVATDSRVFALTP